MRHAIRVLHIIKTLGLGGAETNLLNLACAFDAACVETHVAYSQGGEIEPRFRALGVRLFKYAEESHRIKSPHTLLIVKRLAAYIRRHGIDVVHTHNFNGHVWGLVAARLAGAKVVEHVHDLRYTPTEVLERRHGLMNQYRYTRYFRRRSDRIVVLTDDHRKFVVENAIAAPERVVKIPNGLPFGDVATPAAGREGFGIPADALVILTAARMDPTKNIELIVRIAPRVLASVPHACFVVAGSGTHLEAYRRAARDLGLPDDRVRLIGFHPDVNALLSTADLFVLPSFLELHSIAILEAMRMAVPVVVSRGVGCNDEFIEDGVDGFLCDPFDDAPWVDAIVRLAGDPEWRAEVGRRGRDTCRRLFDIRDTARRFEALYADVTA